MALFGIARHDTEKAINLIACVWKVFFLNLFTILSKNEFGIFCVLFMKTLILQ